MIKRLKFYNNLFGNIQEMIFYLYGLCDDAISKLFESALFIGSAWAVGVFYGRTWFLYHLGFIGKIIWIKYFF